jgi:hypothetical protein
LTVIPFIQLESGMGTLFQPKSTWVFAQEVGGSILKRYLVIAVWDETLDDYIDRYKLVREHPIQKNDLLMVPSVSPYRFPIDDADAYPGSHIEITTLLSPGPMPTGPTGGS